MGSMTGIVVNNTRQCVGYRIYSKVKPLREKTMKNRETQWKIMDIYNTGVSRNLKVDSDFPKVDSARHWFL